jgi:hypothetical protein
MNVIVTLNAGLDSDLGPNFNLTSNGSPITVTPSTATLTDLLSPGVNVVVDNSATQIIVTSTGTCTNALTLSIT